MDDLWIMVKGIVIGLAIAAPVGPIGILCMRQTLTYGWQVGMATGLGAASADAVYGCIAALGLMAVSQILVAHQIGIRLIGGLFLAYLGGQIFLSLPVASPSSADGADAETEESTPTALPSLWKNYSTTFLLTLTNPATILMFLGIFSGQPQLSSSGQSTLLVLGVFVGSALWWLTLSSVVNFIRQKLSNQILRWINQGSGLVIFGFGVAIVLQALLQNV
ncbi:MAG: LysE family translocator [Prochlorotrichaceae cyanobacterium]